MTVLLIATNNQGKLVEMRSLLKGLPATIASPADFDISMDVLEDGTTYYQNATRKAEAYLAACRQICDDPDNKWSDRLKSAVILADDSGLEVDALGGAPGIHSARYSPQAGAKDADRRTCLLNALKKYPHPWTAHFHCTIAVTRIFGSIEYAEGQCLGEIIPEERGTNGFGYDPIFLIPQYGRTMAELSMDEKNRISHRARAVTAALPLLEKMFKNKKK